MKRLLSTTTALALALSPIQPLPAMAQTLTEDGSVVAADGTVLCTPTADQPCNLKKIKKEYRKAQAAAEGAAVTEEPAAPAETVVPADDAAAATEAEAAATKKKKKKAEAAAAAAAAEEAAAAQKAADDAAAAEKAAADEAAAAEAAAQKAAEDAAAADAAAAQKAADDAAAAEKAAADEAAAAAKAADEAAAADKAAADATATEKAAAEADAAEAAKKAADEAAAAAETPATDPAVPADGGTAATDGTDAPVAVTEDGTAPAAGETPAEPVATEEATTSVEDLLSQPSGNDDAAVTETPVAAAADPAADATTAAPTVTETVVTEDDTRTSAEDFATTTSGEKNDKAKKKKKSNNDDDELSDLQKVGLVALAAVAVGAYMYNKNRVVANTGDRVVVERDDGTYAVYKDDDALLHQPGSTVKTETFNDGSTRTTVVRADGTQIITIRDATGRVLRRAAYDAQGREVVLIDDLVPEERVNVSTLPKPRNVTVSAQDSDAELAAALRAAELADLGRTFSLRQIREIPEVRALATTIDVDSITFDTGSAAISTTEAKKLASLGRFISNMIAKNPKEMFLIEGHTDAVGSGASNLTLSDRRAESVALALTEYYDVPPENLVVQGYGESELLIPTLGDERRNRRVAVRIITPLLRSAQ